MAHPTMYRDNDPGLRETRELCLALPDAQELESHGRPTFRTKKIFAVYGATEKGGAAGHLQHPHSVLFLPDPSEVALLLEEERFFVPAYYGPSGWVGLDFDVATVNWGEVRELVEDSYRNTAPRRLVARMGQARGK